jgi:hypothetical protein
MKGDLGESFEKLKKTMFLTYRGCTIYQGFYYSVWNDNMFPDTELAKAAIDASYSCINNSVPPSKTE